MTPLKAQWLLILFTMIQIVDAKQIICASQDKLQCIDRYLSNKMAKPSSQETQKKRINQIIKYIYTSDTVFIHVLRFDERKNGPAPKTYSIAIVDTVKRNVKYKIKPDHVKIYHYEPNSPRSCQSTNLLLHVSFKDYPIPCNEYYINNLVCISDQERIEIESIADSVFWGNTSRTIQAEFEPKRSKSILAEVYEEPEKLWSKNFPILESLIWGSDFNSGLYTYPIIEKICVVNDETYEVVFSKNNRGLTVYLKVVFNQDKLIIKDFNSNEYN